MYIVVQKSILMRLFPATDAHGNILELFVVEMELLEWDFWTKFHHGENKDFVKIFGSSLEVHILLWHIASPLQTRSTLQSPLPLLNISLLTLWFATLTVVTLCKSPLYNLFSYDLVDGARWKLAWIQVCRAVLFAIFLLWLAFIWFQW